MTKSSDTLLMIPTYNEADNIEPLYLALSKLQLGCDFLFIDDNSPDGTGRIIDRLVDSAEQIHALHRSRKMGIGAAHQDGIAWAYEKGYKYLLTMDADFTHSPERVKDFLTVANDADVVVGTRFERAQSLAAWPWYRKLLTHAAHRMTVLLLRMPYDASGAFRVYSLEHLPKEIFGLVRDSGYSFFWESLYVLWINGKKIHQIPIDLPQRAQGDSKMRLSDVIRGVRYLFTIFIRTKLDRPSLLLAEGGQQMRDAEQAGVATWNSSSHTAIRKRQLSKREQSLCKAHVVVIGAGFTGLAAALQLAAKGINVTVLESMDVPGGLAASFPVGTTQLECFYHHWYTGEKYVMEMITELGLMDRVTPMSAPAGVCYANTIYRFASPLDVLRFKPLSPLGRIRLGLLVLKARSHRDWRELDRISAADWLKDVAGEEVFKVMWEPLLIGKFGAYAYDVSAAWLWSKLVLRGGNRDKGGKEQLACLKGGFAALLESAVERIERNGGKVRCGTPATGLEVRDSQVGAVVTGDEAIPCDAVIATPALPIVADLMAPHISKDYAGRLRSINYLGVLCLILQLDRSLTGIHWMSVNDPSFPFVAIVEHTNLVPPEDFAGRHIVYLGKYLPCSSDLYSMPDQDLFEYAKPHIARMLPEFDESWVKDYHVWRAPYGQPVVTCGYLDKVPKNQTPLDNLFIASMAQVYPEDRGTNHAIREGRKVADQLAEGCLTRQREREPAKSPA